MLIWFFRYLMESLSQMVSSNDFQLLLNEIGAIIITVIGIGVVASSIGIRIFPRPRVTAWITGIFQGFWGATGWLIRRLIRIGRWIYFHMRRRIPLHWPDAVRTALSLLVAIFIVAFII